MQTGHTQDTHTFGLLECPPTPPDVSCCERGPDRFHDFIPISFTLPAFGLMTIQAPHILEHKVHFASCALKEPATFFFHGAQRVDSAVASSVVAAELNVV